MPKIVDLAGQVFGKLTVIKESGNRTTFGSKKWLCQCSCGNSTEVSSPHLVRGDTRSCGCLQIHQQQFGSVTHGHAKTGAASATYIAWQCMLARCNNPNNSSYSDYGERGIRVCDRWSKFDNFLTDMGEKPEGLLLDRRNNDGNYEPGNCRWVNSSISNQNRRPFRKN